MLWLLPFQLQSSYFRGPDIEWQFHPHPPSQFSLFFLAVKFFNLIFYCDHLPIPLGILAFRTPGLKSNSMRATASYLHEGLVAMALHYYIPQPQRHLLWLICTGITYKLVPIFGVFTNHQTSPLVRIVESINNGLSLTIIINAYYFQSILLLRLFQIWVTSNLIGLDLVSFTTRCPAIWIGATY